MDYKTLRDEFNAISNKKGAVNDSFYHLCEKISDAVIEKLAKQNPNGNAEDEIIIIDDESPLYGGLIDNEGNEIRSIRTSNQHLLYKNEYEQFGNIAALSDENYNEVFNFLLNWLES